MHEGIGLYDYYLFSKSMHCTITRIAVMCLSLIDFA